MNMPSELTTLKDDDDVRKFFSLYENLVTKSLPESERTEKNVAYFSRAAFDFYFDRFTLDKVSTEEAKDHGVVKKVMLEHSSAKTTESEVMREALTLRYDGVDIPTFLSKSDRSKIRPKSARMSNSSYFEMPLKSDKIFFEFVLL